MKFMDVQKPSTEKWNKYSRCTQL